MAGDYFSGTMVNRQRLFWAVAARRQLERWEPIVATAVREAFSGRQLGDGDIWLGEIEHHLRSLLLATSSTPLTSVPRRAFRSTGRCAKS